MEDQTLNPFRAPSAGRPARRLQPAVQAEIVSPTRWYRDLPICISLVALILIAYWGVWNYDFVYFDDPGYVTDNLNVEKGLPLFTDPKVFWDSIVWAFTSMEQSNWHPLSWLSHMLDVQLYGLNAGGHHVTNIILHTCNTLFLFLLLSWMTGRSWCSAAVAALFAVHPMHVESVVWIAERKDVLSTFLGLLGFLAYVGYTKKPSVLRYIPVFVLLALGLLAKPMLITFPCVCLLLDYWPLRRLKVARNANPTPRPTAAERPAALRRKAKRNQRLPTAAREPRAPQPGVSAQRSIGEQIFRLVVEKIPLFALSAFSAVITPIAQAHGGSMASESELSIFFRLENSMQSYLTYITRMFWPGKMSVLYLLDPDHVNHYYTALAVAVMVSVTALVIWAAVYHGRRYLAVGWFWYVGTLVPVIGIVQVGEQTHADRYTYIPYVGLFIMLAWGVADLMALVPQIRPAIRYAAGFAMVFLLATCVGWTKYQLQFWTGVEVHLRHALTITPDNWNMLNNLGVYLWKQAQEQDVKAGKAEAEGNAEEAKGYQTRSVALKKDAEAQWIHGITARPTATDIHSNLGYMYSERNDLDKAEWHLTRAVDLKPISPRPHNNLGRVLLRRSQQREADAREAEANSKIDLSALEVQARSNKADADKLKAIKERIQKSGLSDQQFQQAEAAKVKPFKDEAKFKLNRAMEEFNKAVELDPSLLEARLNLGEVYLSSHERDKAENNADKAEDDLVQAEMHYNAILKLMSGSVKDRETISNFSQASLGLARIALARKNSDAALPYLEKALELNPQNLGAMQYLVLQRFLRGEYRDGEKVLWSLLAVLPPPRRRDMAEQLFGQLMGAGNPNAAVRALDFLTWAFATSPDPPRVLDPEAAGKLAQRLMDITKNQDPLALDTVAAALAANGQYKQAVQVATAAINLANSKGNKQLAGAIAPRLLLYQQEKPYRCDLNGNDRP